MIPWFVSFSCLYPSHNIVLTPNEQWYIGTAIGLVVLTFTTLGWRSSRRSEYGSIPRPVIGGVNYSSHSLAMEVFNAGGAALRVFVLMQGSNEIFCLSIALAQHSPQQPRFTAPLLGTVTNSVPDTLIRGIYALDIHNRWWDCHMSTPRRIPVNGLDVELYAQELPCRLDVATVSIVALTSAQINAGPPLIPNPDPPLVIAAIWIGLMLQRFRRYLEDSTDRLE